MNEHPPGDRRAANRQTPGKQSLVLLWTIALIAGLTRLATISHGLNPGGLPTIVAALFVAFATVPPLYLRRWLFKYAAFPLAVIAWRFQFMLIAVPCAAIWEGDARKCFLITLMACYFAVLPLESLLLIRQCETVRSK